MREQARHLLLAARVAVLEPGRGLRVDGTALVDDERPVRRLLDQRVLEAVLRLGPPASLAEQVEPHQRRERRTDVVVPAHRLQEREPELPPEDGGRHQDRVGLRVEPVDPREDHLLHGRRDLDLDVVIEAPTVLVPDERARIGQRADELLEEERVAVGVLEDPLLHVVGQRALADERAEQVEARVARQRLQRHLGRPMRELPATRPP